MGKHILVVGNGGREHALCWRLAQSPSVEQITCAPGNPGTAEIAKNVRVGVMDVDGITALAVERQVDLVVVGPEAPLAIGLADRIRAAGIPVFGPSQAAAQIETSKTWAKELMAQAGVQTARYVAVKDFGDGLIALQQFTHPVVIKADGLAAGKGVVVTRNYEESVMALSALLEERNLGSAAETVVIEEFLTGPEVSILALTDGEAIRILTPSCDHKRALDGDRGPNTGGMGAYAPTNLLTADQLAEIERTILQPVIDTMRVNGTPMNGVLYAGLMLTPSGSSVLEFNARFGDPETQVVLPLVDGDFGELCLAVANGTLASYDLRLIDDVFTCGVVMASGGYPGPHRTGLPITGIETASQGALVFQAGTDRNAQGELVSAGGRVLTVVGMGPTMVDARLNAYAAVEQITFEAAQFRSDIGTRET